MPRETSGQSGANIREVAERAGVSTATVSRAFRAPHTIGKLTRARVLEIADHIGYRPPHLRNMGAGDQGSDTADDSGNHLTIGFVYFSAQPMDRLETNPFYSDVYEGARAEAERLCLNLTVMTTDRHTTTLAVPEAARNANLAGILLVGGCAPEIQAAYLRHFRRIVLVDNRDSRGLFDSIVSDGFGGAYAVTHYLLDLGHRRIAFVTAEAGIYTLKDRLNGYRCALLDYGVQPDPNQVVRLSFLWNAETRQERMRALLTGPDRPTAIVCANDFLAQRVTEECRAYGLSIPGDISVTGFDDLQRGAEHNPPLTTVRVDTEAMGRLGMQRLAELLRSTSESNGEVHAEPCTTTIVPVSLVVRESCRHVGTC